MRGWLRIEKIGMDRRRCGNFFRKGHLVQKDVTLRKISKFLRVKLLLNFIISAVVAFCTCDNLNFVSQDRI